MKITVIIVAGGKGTRMQADKPKQYLELYDKPILMETIANVSRQLQNDDRIIVVVPREDESFVRKLIRNIFVQRSHFPLVEVTGGGDTRAESVLEGLNATDSETEIIAVHDGVRPFVNASLFRRLMGAVKDGHGSVLPALPSDDSIRLKVGNDFKAIPRETVFRVQTPQVFDAALLRHAYRLYAETPDTTLTDDASIVSALTGEAPYVVEGLKENLKITNPVDLALAKIIAETFDATK